MRVLAFRRRNSPSPTGSTTGPQCAYRDGGAAVSQGEQVRRRSFLQGLVLFSGGLSHSAFAQDAKPRRIGWLTGGSPTSHARVLAAFREGLREHGWIEGRDISLELRWAEGRLDRLPALAAELVSLKPDVLLTAANAVHIAMRKATSTIPIVMATGADPVAAGLATSLARPGGNVTGLTGLYESTPMKMLELAFAMAPPGTRIAVLMDAHFISTAFRAQLRQDFERAIRTAGYRLEVFEAATPEDVARSLSALEPNRPDVLIVLPGSMIFAMARELAPRATALRIPVIFPFEEFVEAGGLMSYAPELIDSYRRAARYVDRILRGANPAELPIEQATRLSLAVNLTTARQLGIRIPPAVLARADRVIE